MRMRVYGTYRLTFEEIKQKIRHWNLSDDQLERIKKSLRSDEPIFITGPHGPTGKTTLVDRLVDLGLDAVEIDIEKLVTLDVQITPDPNFYKLKHYIDDAIKEERRLDIEANRFTNLIDTKEEYKINGTIYLNYNVYTSYVVLQAIFGNAEEDEYDDKVSIMFKLELADGTPFTIYDYKEDGLPLKHPHEEFTFNIGTHTKEGAIKAYEFINKKIRQFQGGNK